MSSSSIPTAQQLEAARLARWHQQPHPDASVDSSAAEGVPGNAGTHRLLTLDACRSFVQQSGLLLFAPRPQLAGSPAPSLVEATLGRAEATPSLAEAADARRTLAAMVAEGTAVALNLLGAPGTTAEAPDFVVSAAVFPFVFTLRGDKLWKQPPAAAGPLRVSPLAANIFVLLENRQPRSAGDLANELGKGVTEAAVLRALGELWQHLRVLPVLQADEAATLWELSGNRFTKQIKAGANAGQPTALSALASLYLGQVLLASEDEIATFLSPLASRSRVHDVLQGLSAAQQLESIVLEGKRCLHVAKDLLEFPELAPAAAISSEAATPTEEGANPGESSRIRKFAPSRSTRAAGSGRPLSPRRDFSGARGPSRRAPSQGSPGPKRRGEFRAEGGSPRTDNRAPRERPAGRSGSGSAEQSGNREDRGRPSPPFRKRDSDGPPRGWRPTQRTAGDGSTGQTGDRPRRESPREGPSRQREGGFVRRDNGPGRDERPRRAAPSRGADQPFRRFDAPRGPKRPFATSGPAKPGERPDRKGPGERPFQRSSGVQGDRPRPPRPERSAPRPGRSAGDRAPSAPRRPSAGFPSRAGGFGDRDRRPESGDRGRSAPRERSGSASRPARPFTARPRSAAPRAEQAPGKPFAKFAGGNKPWGKRPPPRRVPREPEEER